MFLQFLKIEPTGKGDLSLENFWVGLQENSGLVCIEMDSTKLFLE